MSADCLGPSPQGLLLWEVQPARRRTAWVPSSCRVRGECPPSCHPGSREKRVLTCMMAYSPSLAIHTVTAGIFAQPSTQMLSLCSSRVFGQSLFRFNEALGEKRCMQGEDVENPGCGELYSSCDSISLLASCRTAAVNLSHPWSRAQSLLRHSHKANTSEHRGRG